MALRIRSLKCRVRVKGGSKGSALFKDEKPAKPSMEFALPNATAQSVDAPPLQTATEERGTGAGQQRPVSPAGADSKAVAGRVYDLMREEAMRDRLRMRPW